MKLVKEYSYTDESGNLLYKMARYHDGEKKTFRPYRYCNGEWIMNLNDVRHVLYNLPAVIKSDEIYFVEGEKDVDNLNTIGLTASTSASGANGFKKYAHEYMESLRDKTIYIIPDNDEAGRKYANDVYCAVCKVAKKAQILDLVNEIPELKEKGDISDVLEEYGKEKTLEIIENLKDKNYDFFSSTICDTNNLNEKGFKIALSDIEKLSKEELLDKSMFNYLLSVEDEFEREKIISELEIRAKELNCLPTLKNILKLYKQKIKKANNDKALQHNDIAEILLQENSFAIYENNLYIYINGVYKLDTKTIERKIIELTPSAKSHIREEIYKYLELKDNINMNLDKESNIINFKNGLYDLAQKKLYQHTPEFFSINQININYKEDAKAVAEMDDFLNKISNYNIQRKQAILEMTGYCMTTSMKLQKVFILYGETAKNGKSTFLKVITQLIGRDNVGYVPFQDICTNRFASSGIQGRILNSGSEMTEECIKDISLFKALTGGDNVEIERKFKDRQSISPYTKFIFSANVLPHVSDKTNAFYRRLHIIPFEKSFSDEEVRQFDINKILTNDALEYLARISVDAYMSMNGMFANHQESEREVNKYRVASNSVLTFANDIEYLRNLYDAGDGLHKAINVYKCYKDYCMNNQLQVIGQNKFYSEIEKSGAVIEKRFNNQKAYMLRDIKKP